jgi:hypothetical protein
MLPIKINIFKTIKDFLPPSMDNLITAFNEKPRLNEINTKIKNASSSGKPTNILLKIERINTQNVIIMPIIMSIINNLSYKPIFLF